METVEITELVNKAKRGDKEALIQLVMEKKSEYYKLAFVYMENKEDALDALEDMIVILHEKLKNLKKEEAFYSWSKTILVNCCKNRLKRNRRLVSLDSVQEASYESSFESSESRLDILAQLKNLNTKQQEAIKLKFFLGLGNEEIAHMCGVPIGTIKSRISIGLKKLKECFGGNY